MDTKLLERITRLEKRVNKLETLDLVGNYTAGGLLFADSSGNPTFDASNLFWDDTNNRLGIGNNAPTVTLDVTGAVKTSSTIQPGGVAVSYTANLQAITNNGVAALGMSNFGFVFVQVAGTAAIFAINGSSHTTTEISDPSGVFSNTAGTVSSTNIYWSAGNSRYEIENKRGSTLNHRIWIFDAA